MIADMIDNKKLNPVLSDLFIRGRKVNISIVFITQSYLKHQKDVRLNSTRIFTLNVRNKGELHEILILNVLKRSVKKCTAEKYSFLFNDD